MTRTGFAVGDEIVSGVHDRLLRTSDVTDECVGQSLNELGFDICSVVIVDSEVDECFLGRIVESLVLPLRVANAGREMDAFRSCKALIVLDLGSLLSGHFPVLLALNSLRIDVFFFSSGGLRPPTVLIQASAPPAIVHGRCLVKRDDFGLRSRRGLTRTAFGVIVQVRHLSRY